LGKDFWKREKEEMKRTLIYEDISYTKRESEPLLDLFRLLFFLMCVPLVTIVIFLSLVVLGFAMLGMCIKDLIIKLGE
jgi:TRAP-type mannitol/chloroaromatic compound transport system permease small subunit